MTLTVPRGLERRQKMKITIRSDSVTLEGYVNAVERNSKPLTERGEH